MSAPQHYYCDACKVRLLPHIQNCPLCGKYIDGEHDPAQNAAYPKPDFRYYRRLKWAHLVAILLLLGSLACFFVDLFFTRTWWSAYVAASAVVFYFVAIFPTGRKRFYWKEIFINIALVFLYVVFVDVMTNRTVDWSPTYVIPIVSAVFATAVGITILVSPKKTAADSLLALLIVFLFTLTVFLLGLLLFRRILPEYTIIPIFVALLVTAFWLIFIALFRFKEFVRELFKKFRF